MARLDEAFSPEVLRCALDRWAVFWGDPWLTGTVSMLAYGLAGLVLLKASRRTDARDRRLWRFCGILFFLQVLNTHVDLHALPGAYGHCLARAQGWYEDRGPVKMLGAALIGAAMLAVLVVAVVGWWRSIGANTLLVAGVTVALGSLLIRGAGVNVAEAVYNNRLGPFRWAELIEYGGVLLAALAGWRRLRQMRRGRPARARPLL